MDKGLGGPVSFLDKVVFWSLTGCVIVLLLIAIKVVLIC